MPAPTSERTTLQLELVANRNRRDFLRLSAFAGAGLVVGVPALAGCQSGSNTASSGAGTPPTTPTGVLRVANNGEPVSFDPAIGASVADTGITAHNVYESLVRYKGSTSDLEGVLATSFESSPDAREWLFHIRDGVVFHDGEPLTSSAAKASFEYAKSSAGAFGNFLPTKAVYDDSDPHVLRVTVPTPFPDLARNLSVLRVVSPKLIHAGPAAVAKTPSGTGPFKFVSYTTAQTVVLEANPNYRGPGPYLQRVEFPIIPDADARVAALRSGSIDMVLRLAPQNAVSLRGTRDIEVVQNNSWAVGRLSLATKTAPLDNPKIRQALAHAIDRQALVKAVLGGVGGAIDDSWVAPGLYGCHPPAAAAYTYDQGLAKRLVAESGVATPIPLTIVWSPDEGAQFGQMAQAIAGMLNPIGFNVDVRSVTLDQKNKVNTAAAGTARAWPAAVEGSRFITGTGAHPIALRFLQRNFQVDDQVLNSLQDRIMQTPNGPERLELFADLEQRISEVVPEVPLYSEVTLHALRKSVQGFVPPQDGILSNYGQTYVVG